MGTNRKLYSENGLTGYITSPLDTVHGQGGRAGGNGNGGRGAKGIGEGQGAKGKGQGGRHKDEGQKVKGKGGRHRQCVHSIRPKIAIIPRKCPLLQR